MRKASIVAAVVAALVVPAAMPASADHAWGEYHWQRSTNPVHLTVVDKMTSDWDVHLTPALTDWNKSAALSLTETDGSTTNRDRKQCRAETGKIVACNAAYGFNGWLGLAQIWVSGDHISKAITKVNDSYFSTSTYNNANAKRHVLCQELGHDFGLDHQYTQPSCMDDVNGLFDSSYVSPGSHDYDQLATIYSHLDGASSAPGGPGKGNGKGLKGHRHMSVRREGTSTVYTFVIHAHGH